ncbi:hypothetical protein D6764_05845 [Candidatus Woesearchaeota archaeon]|nr:MAG: hypothetical protein D6764_05845 [Candidatus Woesearchaeota archaeon]
MRKNWHNRKSQHYQLVAIVALVAFLLVTMPLYAKFKEKSSETTTHTACMQSIKYASSFKLDSSEYSKRIKCPMEWHEESAKDKFDAMGKITRRMISTWDEFQGGKAELFKDLGKTNYCVFRHVIEFKNPEKIGPITAEDLVSYQQGVLIRRNGQETSAYEYFTGKKTGKLYDWSKVSAPPLNPEDPLAIVVIYSKRGGLNEMFVKMTGGGAALGAGIGIGVAILGIATGGLAWIPLSATATILTSTTLGGVAGGYLLGDYSLKTGQGISEEHDAAVAVLPYTEEWLEKLNCEFLPGEQTSSEEGET